MHYPCVDQEQQTSRSEPALHLKMSGVDEHFPHRDGLQLQGFAFS